MNINALPTNLDISEDTNLAVSTPITLTDDTIGFDPTAAFFDTVTWGSGVGDVTWTFDVSGTNTTMTAGSAIMTFSHTVQAQKIGDGTAVMSSGNLKIADGGRIGSLTTRDAIQIDSSGNIVMSQDLTVDGSITTGGPITIDSNSGSRTITGFGVNIEVDADMDLSGIRRGAGRFSADPSGAITANRETSTVVGLFGGIAGTLTNDSTISSLPNFVGLQFVVFNDADLVGRGSGPPNHQIRFGANVTSNWGETGRTVGGAGTTRVWLDNCGGDFTADILGTANMWTGTRDSTNIAVKATTSKTLTETAGVIFSAGVYIDACASGAVVDSWSLYSVNDVKSFIKGDLFFGQISGVNRIGTDSAVTLDLYAGTSVDVHADTNITGTLTSTDDITISSPTPILIFKDSNNTGDASVGFIEWRDSVNTRLGFFGNSTNLNDDLLWKNESTGGHIGIQTIGGGEFRIFANTVLNGNSITGIGTLIAEQLTSTDDITMQGELLTLGSGSAADVVTQWVSAGGTGELKWNNGTQRWDFDHAIVVTGNITMNANVMRLGDNTATDVVSQWVTDGGTGTFKWNNANQQFEIDKPLIVSGFLETFGSFFAGGDSEIDGNLDVLGDLALDGTLTAIKVFAIEGNGTFTINSPSGILYGTAIDGGSITVGTDSNTQGAFAGGFVEGGTIGALADGSVASGNATTDGIITASGIGSIAQGSASSEGSITSTGEGSFAQGQASGGTITAINAGAFAQGQSGNSNITASGAGSFAQGDATTDDITASATNAVQFGPGTNNTADSLQVGSGVLLEAVGDITAQRNLDVLGISTLGTGGNNTQISAAGFQQMFGTATVFKDINIGAATLAGPPGLQPGIDNFVDENGADTGIATFGLAVGEGFSGEFEMQHDYKEGSDITFHIHWQGIVAPTGTDKVQFQLTYTFGIGGATLDPVTVITIEQDVDTQYEFRRTSFAVITGTNINIEDQFIFTLQRIAASTDEYGGEALTATVGIHYEVDTIGSNTITSKL